MSTNEPVTNVMVVDVRVTHDAIAATIAAAVEEAIAPFRVACEAALAYDACILGRASRGEVSLLQGGGGVATGEDLDALYDAFVSKARAALGEDYPIFPE